MMAINAKEIKSTRVNFILNLRYKTFFDKGLQKNTRPILCRTLSILHPFIWDQGSQGSVKICFALRGRNPTFKLP